MGFFSWRTADTDEPIMNRHTRHCRPVYLLLPDGSSAFEPAYDGYGVFDGIDAYQWLGEMNASAIGLDPATMTESEFRSLGLRLAFGDEPYPYPLKFSFSETARYDDLPASRDCPTQGYFAI